MTNAEARFNKSLRPRKPEGSLGRTARTSTSILTQLLNYDSVSIQPVVVLFVLVQTLVAAINDTPCFI